MKLYYFQSREGNFGDDLNAWIWPQLLGPNFFDNDASTLLVGIGTLLNHRIPKAGRTLVFGSGFGYGSMPAVDATWEFLCVRGPKTAEQLGLAPDLAITDPAILIHPLTRQFIRPTARRIGYIPHCDSAAAFDWASIASEAGVHYIDPRWSVERVIAEIGSCERIVTEAMHGAIFSDAMRIPWVAATAYPHISAFKWEDWCAAMQLDYRPQPIPAVWAGDGHLPPFERLKAGVKRALMQAGLGSATWTPPQPARSPEKTIREAASALRRAAEVTPILSADDTHACRLEQLQARLEQLKALRATKE